MEAILKNGGIRNCKNDLYFTLTIFNSILECVQFNSSSEDLLTHLDRLKHKVRKARKVFPFSYYAVSDGIAIYQEGNSEMLIFVPCETDVEI